jgi:hypothetical protein
MTYTKHGYHIPGSPDDPLPPMHRARCGGPMELCKECNREIVVWQEKQRTESRLAEPTSHLDHQLKAKIGAVEVFNKEVMLDHGAVGQGPVTVDDLYTVAFAYILGNWKCWLSSDAWVDTSYFEVTYNKEKGQMYVDHYRKVTNTMFEDDPLAQMKDMLDGDAR